MGRPDIAGSGMDDAVISSPVATGRMTNAAQAGMDDVPASTGILGLSMLSAMIIGLMAFYVVTRSKQS
jgi:hypothetical protein